MKRFLRLRLPVILCLTISALVIAVASYAAEPGGATLNLSDPIATVNGVPITYADFITSLKSRLGSETIQNLIFYAVVKQATAAAGIQITDDDIDTELNNFITYNFSSQDEFINQLQRARMTLGEVRSQIEMDLELRELGKREVVVTEDQVKAFFDENKASLYDEGERIEARQILTNTEEEANKVIAELKAGADFAELAAAKSQDTGTKDRGGYIGVFPRGVMVKEFEDAAFAAKKGDLVGPVKTDFGYHVIEILDKLPPQEAVYEDVKAQVESDLKEKLSRSTDAILIDLLSQANIVINDADYSDLQDALNALKESPAPADQSTTPATTDQSAK